MKWTLLALLVVCVAGLAGASPYSDAVLADGPLAYWRCDDAGATVTDIAGGHNGAATGGVLFGQAGLLPAEPGGKAIATSGTERAVVPAFEKFPTGSTGYTAEYWLRIESSVAGYHNIVGDGDGVDWYMMNYLTAASRIRAHYSPAVLPASSDSATVLQVGESYYIATTWDQTTGTGNIYINGLLDHTVSTTASSPNNTNNQMFLGKDNREPGGDLTIDEVAFYNKALSYDRVIAHAVAGGLHPSVSLSTDVLGTGHFPVGNWDAQDGYSSASGTVELIGRFTAANAASVTLTRAGGGPVADLSSFVVGDGTAGDMGSDTHGRGGNLWLPGDGETDVAHAGLGCHANKFITFDLEDIRSQHLGGTDVPLVLAGRVGVNGNVGGQNPPNAVIQGGVWLDGERMNISPELSRDDSSHAFNVILPNTGRYLTLAMLNGNASTAYDDVAFRDVMLRANAPLATATAESRGPGGTDYNFTTINGPSASDYADANSANGVTFTLVGGTAHSAGQQPDGNGRITVLNDGYFPTGDPPNNVTFLHGDGEAGYSSILIDLNTGGGMVLDISEINVFGSNTTHTDRDFMIFDLFASAALTAPDTLGDLLDSGWEAVASVREIPDPKSQHTRLGVNITDIAGQYRYLLLNAYPDPNSAGGVWSSHYLEVDVHGELVPEPATLALLGLGLAALARRRRR